jgi:protein-L-isoaspartate O-methyltransferase
VSWRSGREPGGNAAILAERVGPTGHVVSVEVDPAVADGARRALAAAGYAPLVVTGDGTNGYAPDARYDRVVRTASVREIPRAWLEQTRPGGVIVTPWGCDFGDDALTRLEVRKDGSASGRCGIGLAFMRVRHQRRDFVLPPAQELDTAETTRTTRGGRELFEMVTFDHGRSPPGSTSRGATSPWRIPRTITG